MLATLWSGPVGLATTGWTFVSRRLRVSLGFWLLATISVTALVAPVVLTCAYPVVTGNVNHQIVATVSVFDLSAVVDEDVARSQRMLAYNIWQTGKPVADQFLRNAYAEHGVNSSEHSGAWFLTGDSQGSEMPISGIRVLGGCEAWKTFIEPSRRLDHCTTEFGAGLKQDSVGELTVAHRTAAYSWPRLTPHVIVTQGVTFADCRSDTAMITNSSSCANVGLTTEFGRWSQSSVVCRLWDEFDPESILADNIVRCNATVKPGTALVDGINMTFSQFTYAAPGYNEATSSASSIPVDPIAAIMQSDLRWLRQSVALKTAVVRTGPSREEALAAGMWDGIMAMSVSLWLEASRPS